MTPWTYIGVGLLAGFGGGVLWALGMDDTLTGPMGAAFTVVGALMAALASVVTGIGVIAEGVRIGTGRD